MKVNTRLIVVITTLFTAVMVFNQCINRTRPDLRGKQFAGSQTCINCHKQIVETYHLSAHNNTSAVAMPSTVNGTFNRDANDYRFPDGSTVSVDKKGKHLVQVLQSINGRNKEYPMDIVIGSGRKAQTFLYYDSSTIRQLPLSWFVPANSWAISPGYPADHAWFNRQIPSTCFGCHSSFIKTEQMQSGSLQVLEKFEEGRALFGIDCERCHGPAAAHVSFHERYPQIKQAKFMTAISQLNRTQKLDMCAVCHSGLKVPQKPLFDFRPGHAMEDYYFPDFKKPDTATMDVHGTQFQLLSASACFKKSNILDCSSCHNPHDQQRDNIQLFSQKCMSCHQPGTPQFCKVVPKAGIKLADNCVDCHMPELPSKVITLVARNNKTASPDLIRTHLIAVYPAQKNRLHRAGAGSHQ